MCSQCIIGKTVTLAAQVQHGFAGLEKDLDIPYADILEMQILGFPRYRFYNTLYIYRHFLL